MRILHFTYNTSGGAGKVAKQLHLLLRKHGVESALINLQVNDPATGIYTIPALEKPLRRFINAAHYWLFRLFIRLCYPKKESYHFTYNYNYRALDFKEIKKAIPFKPDIIFLHWIADFILPKHIKALHQYYQCPVIWRYNDLAPATGGCHYTLGCINYQTGCGYCPALDSEKASDWSREHWIDKKKVLDAIPVTVINSTHETEVAFQSSPLFADKRQVFIRNSISQELFNPGEKKAARRELDIPDGKKIIFWGATYITEPRKGFDLLLQALENLKSVNADDLFIIIAGNKPGNFSPSIPFDHRFAGLLPVDQLAIYYKAADVVAVTSTEDGGPMIIVESLMCGTPVVSFATGLGLELVITGETGYRAVKSDAKDLAKGLLYVLNLPPAEYQSLSTRCHEKAVSLYGEETEISAYKKLFAEIL